MRLPVPFDTYRRLATSVAVVGALLVVLDGGQGLTGRATGGPVGCGGSPEPGVHGQGLDNRVEAPQRDLPTRLAPVITDQPTLSFVPTPRSSDSFTPRPREPLTLSIDPATVDRPRALPGGDFERRNLAAALEVNGAALFASYLRQTGLDAVFDAAARPFTVFAPNDPAMETFVSEHPDLFEPRNRELLFDILAHHGVAEQLRRSELSNRTVPSVVPGASLEIRRQDPLVVIRSNDGVEARIIGPELVASNGVIFTVDNVLMPKLTVWSHLRNRGHSLFISALEATDQVARFSNPQTPWTVFAPTNDAFTQAGFNTDRMHDPGNRAEVRALIEAHVMPGELRIEKIAQASRPMADGVYVKVEPGESEESYLVQRSVPSATGARTLSVDLPANPGMIHPIDSLLSP